LLLHRIAITLIPGVGDVNAKKLIAWCGSAEAVFREKRQALLKIPGMGTATVDSILGTQVLDRAEREMAFIERYRIRPLFYLDDHYPQRLKHCMDGPVMLYLRGKAELNCPRVLSVVGTRRASSYGRTMTERIISGLEGMDILVVSGLAYGIDTHAHRTALAAGLPTVGILAHGLDRIYPGANRKLAIKMQDEGGLLTEFLSETNPDRENFPRRNRIVAGLSDATLVIESATKGGALITANIAHSYDRDVLAVPGRCDDDLSKGCNYLIKANKAALVESADDIRYIMQWDEKAKGKARQARMFNELSKEASILFDILREHEESSIDFLVMKSRQSNSRIAAALLELEFNGLVKSLPGKMYRAL
jgi:DNA processing protein